MTYLESLSLRQSRSPTWRTLQTLIVGLILFIPAVVFYVQRGQVAEIWRSRKEIWSTRTFNASSFENEFSSADWSGRGLQTKALADWGDYYVKHGRANRTSFFSTIEKSYGFLENCLVKNKISHPWTKTWRRSHKVGIVMSVGSSQARLSAHLIANLRTALGSKLPIEIAYAGDEDLKPEERHRLQSMADDVSFLDLLEIFPHARNDLVKGGWASKPFALLAASHPRTILVDADVIFLQKPDALFDETTELQDTGVLMYHDRVTAGDNGRQTFMLDHLKAMNATPSRYMNMDSYFWKEKSKQEADSGLVAMDKSRPSVFMGLILACWLNTKKVREEVTYKHYHGDKETFWIAMELSGAPYTFPPWYAGQIGTFPQEPALLREVEEWKAVELCGKHMLHVDLVREEPFWFNAAIYEDKDHPSHGYANMTHWWMQPDFDNFTIVPHWRWTHGMACIKEKGVQPLDDRYLDVLSRTIEEAASIDKAMGVKIGRLADSVEKG